MDKFYLLTNETLFNLRSNELFREFLTEFFYELKIRCLLVHTIHEMGLIFIVLKLHLTHSTGYNSILHLPHLHIFCEYKGHV